MKRAWSARPCPQATIYALNGFFQNTGDAYAKINCKPVIGDLNELAEWDVFCRRSGWSGGAAIHIDTGMNRLGLTVAEAQGIIPRINAGDHGITLVMSHLVSAELVNNPTNARQLAAFREIASLFTNVPASLSNSSGIYLGAQFQFDMVRPGAALYGVNPTPEADNPMQPVVDLKARIVQIRNVERGETVGYGGTWTARRPTRLAIVSAGYADGYFRAASANDGTRGAEVVVAGKRCPIAGRISMDLMAVDITDLPPNAARRGHMVTLIGEGITVDELAHHFGTIGYEVLTSLGRRYARHLQGRQRSAADRAGRAGGQARRERRPLLRASGPRCVDLTSRGMKIATFNINNVNRRLPNLLRWLRAAKPDVVCLQELKAADEEFPHARDREGRLRRGLARAENLERRCDPGAQGRAGPDPHRPARRPQRSRGALHRGRRQRHRHRLHLSAERQSAARAEIRLQARLVRAAAQARREIHQAGAAGRARRRLQRRADPVRHLPDADRGTRTR